MRYILHIDTSADIGLIAISADGHCTISKTLSESRNFSAHINWAIAEVLAAAGIELNELSAVAVCAGPGSYTGLRIGMATAKAFCYVGDIPLLATDKLLLMAKQGACKMHIAGKVAAVLKARDGEYFVAIYDGQGECLVAPKHVLKSELIETFNLINPECIIFDNEEIGCIWVPPVEIAKVKFCALDAEIWAETAFADCLCNRIVSLAYSEPQYLKQVYTHK